MSGITYQTNGPFVVGQPTEVCAILADGWLIDWSANYGNMDIVVEDEDCYRATVTPLDSQPSQLYLKAKPDPDFVYIPPKDRPDWDCPCEDEEEPAL